MEITLAVSLLTFLLGLWGGHYFSLLREKRKEFNDIADRMREHLMAESPEVFYMCPSPSGFEFDQLRALSPWWKRAGLTRAKERYEAAKADYSQTDSGSTYQNNVAEARGALEGLLTYAARK